MSNWKSAVYKRFFLLCLLFPHIHTQNQNIYIMASFAHARTNYSKSPLLDLGVREVALKIISPARNCTQEGRLGIGQEIWTLHTHPLIKTSHTLSSVRPRVYWRVTIDLRLMQRHCKCWSITIYAQIKSHINLKEYIIIHLCFPPINTM